MDDKTTGKRLANAATRYYNRKDEIEAWEKGIRYEIGTALGPDSNETKIAYSELERMTSVRYSQAERNYRVEIRAIYS